MMLYIFGAEGACIRRMTVDSDTEMHMELASRCGGHAFAISGLRIPPNKARLVSGVVIEIDPTSAELINDQWTKVRARRDYVFASTVDRLNPMRWAEMTQEQQTAWATYRQQLKDITLQPDPFAIVWPTPPA